MSNDEVLKLSEETLKELLSKEKYKEYIYQSLITRRNNKIHKITK